jgi:predicted GIY-YIG superfamily endonuclease
MMPKEHEHCVYIMASVTGTLYVGITDGIYARMRQHKALQIEGFSKALQVHAAGL